MAWSVSWASSRTQSDSFRPPQDLLADRGHPPDQRRGVLAVEPLRDRGDVLDQVGDVVGEEVDGRDQEVAAAHGRVQDLEIQHRLGRIELQQLGLALRLGPAVALEGVGLLLESLQTLLGQRLQGALDDEVHQLLGRVEAAAVLAGIGIRADVDLAVAAADRLALEEALVDRAELLHRHVAVVDEVALAYASLAWLRSWMTGATSASARRTVSSSGAASRAKSPPL